MITKKKMTIDELIAYYKRNAKKHEYDNGAARALEIDAKPIIDAQAATIAQLREALEGIRDFDASARTGEIDEWEEAWAFDQCKTLAARALKGGE